MVLRNEWYRWAIHIANSKHRCYIARRLNAAVSSFFRSLVVYDVHSLVIMCEQKMWKRAIPLKRRGSLTMKRPNWIRELYNIVFTKTSNELFIKNLRLKLKLLVSSLYFYQMKPKAQQLISNAWTAAKQAIILNLWISFCHFYADKMYLNMPTT